MKKNILIIGNYPPPYGGVPHHIERLTEYLIHRGWTCHVLSGGTSGNEVKGSLFIYKPTYFSKFVALASQLFIRTFNSWLGTGTLNQDEPSFWRRYKIYSSVGANIIKKNDIGLIVSYNLLSYSPVGAYLAEQFGLPHIINIFGEVYKFDSMIKSKEFFARVIERSYRQLSCSSHCGKSVEQLDIEYTVQTVTYGVNIRHFTPGEATSLRNSLCLARAPVVMFVGRLSKEMGLDSFIAAAQIVSSRNPDARFVMVGQTGDFTEKAAKQCELKDGKFILRPDSSYADLPDYYRLADVLVVPTRGERTCSSLAAMEAMATRKAVVGFAVGGIPEIIENEKTGLLVEPESIQALADSICRLLDDESLRNRLAEAAFRESQIHFDEDRVSMTMERHFLDALSLR